MYVNGKHTVLIPHVYTRDDAKREYPEIVATSMLLGELPPVICSCCLGSQRVPGVFGRKQCGQCAGLGFDLMDKKTRWALIKRYHGEGAEERI